MTGTPSHPGLATDLYQRLIDVVSDGRDTTDGLPGLLRAISSLSDEQLRHEPEHRIVTLRWLAAIVARTHSLEPYLRSTNLTGRFAEVSRYFSGRLTSKSQAVLDLIDQAVRDHDIALLADIADHISQGWPGYQDSVFPQALADLASTFPQGSLTVEEATNTSYVLWRRGLTAAGTGAFAAAAEHFAASAVAYERLAYVSDAAWLYVDRIICMLGLGQRHDAQVLRGEQTKYIDEVIADSPATDHDALWRFDDVSDEYSTFVESHRLGEQPLSVRDRDVLFSYVTVADHLLRANTRTASELVAAIDLFSFGWRSFARSPYPGIFARLAEALGVPRIETDTSYRAWLDLLELPRVHPTAEYYFDLAEHLEQRLIQAGLEHEACVAVLDAAIAGYVMYGRAAALQWLEPRRYRPERLTAQLFTAATTAIQTPTGSDHEGMLSIYLAQRCTITRPAFTAAIISLAESRRATTSRNLSLRLTPSEFSVSGVTVYDAVPPVVGALLEVLINEFTEARRHTEAPEPLSSAELAQRLDHSPGSVTQAIHRLRGALRKRFAEVLVLPLDDSAVLQGRPGYRLNPVFVETAMTTFTRGETRT